MNKSQSLISTIRDNYKLSFVELNYFANNHAKEFNLKEKIDLDDCDFKILRSLLYELFDKVGIFLSVVPYQAIQNDYENICLWKYVIYADETEITQGTFASREDAEYIAFVKSFCFYETKLFIEYTKNRYYDETSDSSCLNVNWNHLKKVLNYKRKNLIA